MARLAPCDSDPGGIPGDGGFRTSGRSPDDGGAGGAVDARIGDPLRGSGRVDGGEGGACGGECGDGVVDESAGVRGARAVADAHPVDEDFVNPGLITEVPWQLSPDNVPELRWKVPRQPSERTRPSSTHRCAPVPTHGRRPVGQLGRTGHAERAGLRQLVEQGVPPCAHLHAPGRLPLRWAAVPVFRRTQRQLQLSPIQAEQEPGAHRNPKPSRSEHWQLVCFRESEPSRTQLVHTHHRAEAGCRLWCAIHE